jgi:hypothetical protein
LQHWPRAPQRLEIELTTGESFGIEVPWVFRKDAAAFAALYEMNTSLPA